MSPFKSLKQAAVAVVGNFLSNFIAERMDNAEMLQEVESPVMIVHGQKDELIPFSQSQELLDHCYKSRHTHLVLPPHMTHNKFNIETDLVMPLTKFLAQIRLDLAVTTMTPHVMTTKHVKSKSMQLVISPTSYSTRSSSSTRDVMMNRKYSNGFSDRIEVYSNLTSKKENKRRKLNKKNKLINP